MKKISEVVYEERKFAKEQTLQLTDGYNFNHLETIRRINLYINNRFLDCPDENAIFWNLSFPRIPLYAKNIDMDSKDFYPEGQGDYNFYQAWILKIQFQKWARDNNFDITLNDLSEGIATYGSSVWKKVKENGKWTIKEDDLRNIFFDYSVKDIIDSPVVQMHYLSDNQILERDGWDNREEAVEKAEIKKDSADDFKAQTDQNKKKEVWERWGSFKKDDDSKYTHYIGVGQGDAEVILFEEEFDSVEEYQKKFPYYDFHNGKYRGRWLRIGVVEALFKLQERCNTLVNQNAATTEIASLLLMRSVDTDTNANILTQAQNGMIINSADLQQIGIDNRGLASFLQEMALIEAHADKLSFTPGIISGETPPSGTPFRGMAVMNNQAKSTFRYIRERIGDKIAKILLEEIMPEQVKDWNKGKIISIAGDDTDIMIYDEIKIKSEINNWIKNKYDNGNTITADDILKKETEIRNKLENSPRNFKIEKGFFNFEYGFVYNPVGTKVDKAQKNEAMINALNMVLANPLIQKSPLFKQLLENNNIMPYKVPPIQEEQQQTNKPAQIKPKDSLSAMVDSE